MCKGGQGGAYPKQSREVIVFGVLLIIYYKADLNYAPIKIVKANVQILKLINQFQNKNFELPRPSEKKIIFQ